MNTKTLDQIKDEYYGEVGKAELASRIDKKRTFISKVENDGENITLKTLFDIVERGLGGKLNIEVQL